MRVYSAHDVRILVCTVVVCAQNLVQEELPRLRSEAERAAMLANIICEAYGNYMGAATVRIHSWVFAALVISVRTSVFRLDVHSLLCHSVGLVAATLPSIQVLSVFGPCPQHSWFRLGS